jgi:hypothetical protein
MKPAPHLAFLFLLCALAVVPAHAQTVVNPRTVEFDPSADHATMTADSQPVVQRYDLQIFTVGGTSPYSTASLGKPAPQADGKIRVDFSGLVSPWPLPDGSYQARVAAIGPTGYASSDPSNTFAFQSCSIALGSASQAAPAGGMAGSVTVIASTGCTWTAASNASWVTLGAAGGDGQGAVNFTVAPNLGGTPRAAALTIGGQTFTITQAAYLCVYSLSASGQAFGDAGGPGTVAVTAGDGCAWSAASNASWVTVGTASGGGSGAVSFLVAANGGASARSATLTIAGRAFTVTQAAAACAYSLSAASSPLFTQGGGTGSVTVNCAAGCAWTAVSSASWVAVATPSGSGSAGVAFTVEKNSYPTPRTATIAVGGQTYTVNQDAAKRPTAPKKVRLTSIVGG